MSSSETKKLIHWGWITGEERMLRELERYAKEGWFLRKCTMYHLILEKGNPKELQYTVDLPKIEKDGEDEYLQYFKETGWELACNNNGYYVFYAGKDASPIHTDKELLHQLRKGRLKVIMPLTILFLIVTIGFVVFSPMSMSSMQEIIYTLLAGISGGLLGLFGMICVTLLRIQNHF
jgi:hypothetical protein